MVVGDPLRGIAALGTRSSPARCTLHPGAIVGRMLDDLLPSAFAEPWALAAAARGIPPRSVTRHALRRCVPGLLPNLGLFVVGLTGGAVAVEQIFDIPGLGRLTLRAAVAQDLPVLQTSALTLEKREGRSAPRVTRISAPAVRRE